MRPVILAFTSFYLPGYLGGGPIQSMANIVDLLGEEFDFRIVTMDRDLGDICQYPNVQVDSWVTVGKAKVFYVTRKSLSLLRMIRLMNSIGYDLLYLNSFFDSRFSILPMFLHFIHIGDGRPVIIAPRGEFSSGAYGLKWFKKALFVRFVRLFCIYDRVVWQASTALEVEDVRRVMKVPKSACRIARNLAKSHDVFEVNRNLPTNQNVPSPDQSGALNVCFFSRISPKKNLHFALSVLSRIKVSVQFDIYGPYEDADYWKLCIALIESLPSHVRVEYFGPIDHNKVQQTLRGHDLLFVPTLGENFGHVLVESWSAGVPVLVSDQTPWRGLEQQKLGWDLPLSNIEGFVEVIELCARMDEERRVDLATNCILFAGKVASDATVIDENISLFRATLNSGLETIGL